VRRGYSAGGGSLYDLAYAGALDWLGAAACRSSLPGRGSDGLDRVEAALRET